LITFIEAIGKIYNACATPKRGHFCFKWFLPSFVLTQKKQKVKTEKIFAKNDFCLAEIK